MKALSHCWTRSRRRRLLRFLPSFLPAAALYSSLLRCLCLSRRLSPLLGSAVKHIWPFLCPDRCRAPRISLVLSTFPLVSLSSPWFPLLPTHRLPHLSFISSLLSFVYFILRNSARPPVPEPPPPSTHTPSPPQSSTSVSFLIRPGTICSDPSRVTPPPPPPPS